VCEHTTPDWLLEIRAYWAQVTRTFADESGRPPARGTGEATADRSGAVQMESVAPETLSPRHPALRPEPTIAPAEEDMPPPQRH